MEMIHRQFIQLATLAGVSGLTVIGAVKAGETRTVTYHVKGFSCIRRLSAAGSRAGSGRRV